jgi:hypothetical protein
MEQQNYLNASGTDAKSTGEEQDRESWVNNFLATHKNYFPVTGISDIRDSLLRVDDHKIEEFQRCVLYDPEVVYDKSKKLGMFGVDKKYLKKDTNAKLKLIYFIIFFLLMIIDTFQDNYSGFDFILDFIITFLWYFIDLLCIKKVTCNLNYTTAKSVLSC